MFEDHADPRLRYVLAEVPRVVADPRPRLSLTLFRGAAAGALLQLESELAPSPADLEAIARALADADGPPRLARPDWQAGRVQLAGWLDGDEPQPLLVSVGTPSLVGDPTVLVAARLDHVAAAVAEQALRHGDALPTAILFELEVLGLAGPLAVDAEADLQAIHERLAAEGALTTPWGRARLAKTWEQLVEERLIRLHVLDERGDVEGRRADALSRVGGELVTAMLGPAVPRQPEVRPDAPAGVVELGFLLTARRDALAATARWSYRERSPRRIVHHAAASLIGILGDDPIDDHVFFADLAPPTRELVVRAEPELRALGVAALEVALRLHAAPPAAEEPGPSPASAEAETFVTLTPDETEVRLPAQRDPAAPLWYRVRARFDPEVTRAAARESEWREALGSAVVLSARRLFPPRTLTVATGRMELDWLEHVEVVVRAPDPQEPARTLVLSHAVRSARADFLAPGEGPLAVTAHYRGKDGEPSHDEPPRAVAAGEELLVLDGPFAPSVQVLVVPLPVPGVLSFVTELELVHDGWTHAKAVAWDLPDVSPRTVALRRLRDAPGRYRHRTTTVREDGEVVASEWAESEAPALVVGADGPVTVHRIEVIVLGGPTLRGCLAIELELTAGDVEARALLEGDRDHAELVIVAPRGAPAPVLRVREILVSGRSREHQIDDPPARVVIPLPPAPPP